MTTLMSEGRSIDDIAQNTTGDNNIESVYEHNVEVKCDCSIDRIKNTIIALGKKEAMDILKEQGVLEISCRFCNKKYRFNEEQINEIFNK